MQRDLGGIRFRVGEDGAHSRGWPPEMPGRLRDVFSGAVCVHDLPNGDTMSENIGHTRGEADGGAAAGGIRLVQRRSDQVEIRQVDPGAQRIHARKEARNQVGCEISGLATTWGARMLER